MTNSVDDRVVPKLNKKRVEGSRSRAGCLTCRGRHMRCDEGHPHCTNCLTSKRKCEYLPTGHPVLDRRLQGKSALPGQQAPWLLRNVSKIPFGQLSGDSALDPFDALPIVMPYKSKQLFQYFHQFGKSGRADYEGQPADCLPLATTDQHALRSTLLIAGLHYSWNTGSLQDFQSAFLFHKLESIRNINNCLDHADSKSVVLCVRQICTLCLAETCQGNVAAGDAHIDGLIKFLDVMEKQGLISITDDDLNMELANRYIILTINFLHILKSRLNDFILFRGGDAASPFWDQFSPHALRLMHKWHKIEHLGLENRLKAMRMVPYFFCPIPPTSRLTKINVVPFMGSLRIITDAINDRNENPKAKHDNRVWDEGGPNQIFVNFVHGHISSCSEEVTTSPFSLSGAKSDQTYLPSSWGGIAATSGLYMHSVLNMANVEDPMDPRLIRRLMMIAKRDLDQSVDDMKGEHGRTRQDFWFWKNFAATLALAINHRDLQHQHTAWSTVSEKGVWNLRSIMDWMESNTRAWSKITGTTDWHDAKNALVRTVWPTTWSVEEESFAKALWDRAIRLPATK